MMWMMLWMLFFWVALVGSVVWFVAFLRGRDAGGDGLEVLRDRLARGEIEIGEFHQREDALKRSARGRGPQGRMIAFGVAVTVAAFVIVPAIVMATNDWDMWNMHGRGRNTSGSAAVRAGLHATVSIEDFAFEPGNLEVPVGATVTWINEDSAPHDATARDADWHAERLSNGESDTITFDAAGQYAYYCSIHPSMKALLIVR